MADKDRVRRWGNSAILVHTCVECKLTLCSAQSPRSGVSIFCLHRSPPAPHAGSFPQGDASLAPRRAWPDGPLDCTHILTWFSDCASRAVRTPGSVPPFLFATDRSQLGTSPAHTSSGRRRCLPPDHRNRGCIVCRGDRSCGDRAEFVLRRGWARALASGTGARRAISLSLRHDEVHWLQMLRRGLQRTERQSSRHSLAARRRNRRRGLPADASALSLDGLQSLP